MTTVNGSVGVDHAFSIVFILFIGIVGIHTCICITSFKYKYILLYAHAITVSTLSVISLQNVVG